MYFVDAPTVTREFWTGTASPRSISSPACSPPRPICWPAGRASRSAPTCAPGRASSRRCWTSKLHRHLPGLARRAARHAASGTSDDQAGDCVDCGACVTVCPTGIDIRDGIQLECINCGLCIDACNDVMERTGRPKWLITWDTLADQAAKAAGPARPRCICCARAPSSISRRWCSWCRVMTVALLTRIHARTVSAARPRAAVRAPARRQHPQRLHGEDRQQDASAACCTSCASMALHGARCLAEADEGLGRASRLGADVEVGHVPGAVPHHRGRPSGQLDSTIDFILAIPTRTNRRVYHSLFMGPR